MYLSTLAILGAALAGPPPFPVAPGRAALQSLVSVGKWDGDAWVMSGSGTLVKSSLTDYEYEVITATHVLRSDSWFEPDPRIRVCGTMPIGEACIEVARGAVLPLPMADVSIIGIDMAIAKPARLGDKLNLGDKVILQGFPQGNMIQAPGAVIGHQDGYTKVLSWCEPGSSGGGVFRNGKFVGVVIAIQSYIIGGMELDLNGQCFVQPVFIE